MDSLAIAQRADELGHAEPLFPDTVAAPPPLLTGAALEGPPGR